MDVETAIQEVRARIAAACERSGRDPRGVTLVAATKTVTLEVMQRARAIGVEHFAENYAADLAAKAPHLPATWHFVGKLQRGTAGRVAALADVVHSAEPGRAILAVARRASQEGRELACLAQVDFTGVRQGTEPEALPAFLDEMLSLKGIRPVGLMTLPPAGLDAAASRPYFRRLRRLLESQRGAVPGLRELSMGMSGDYEVAVEEGATMVRVGSALFGKRPPG